MSQNMKQFIYGAILLGGGLYLGNMIGAARVYKDTSGIIANQLFQGASTNLNLHLNLLELLQSKEEEKVIRKLEALIDGDLVALADYSKVPAAMRSTEILLPIEKAKAYRAKKPSATTSPEVSADIKKAFDLVK